MGATLERSWGEIKQELELGLRQSEHDGRATTTETNLFLQRHGYLEETFFSYSLIPARADNGDIEGFYAPAFETTRQKISERRTST